MPDRPAGNRKPDRIRARKEKLTARGHSAAVAAAVAHIVDGFEPADEARWTTHLLDHAALSGVKDGPPRAYFVRLLAHHLKLADYPSAPATLSPADTRFIDARASHRAAELTARVAELARRAGHTPA